MKQLKLLIILIVIVILGVIFIQYQSNDNQATKIQEIMEKSSSFEREFIENQKELDQYRQKSHAVYSEVIHLEVKDKDLIIQKLEDVNEYIRIKDKLLKEAEESFLKSYNEATSIKEHVKELKDEDQKNQATKLVNLINERKKVLDPFFDDYQEQLTLQTSLYQQMIDGNFDFGKLDEMISDINVYSKEMAEIIQQFNEYSKQSKKVENDFYKMAEV
ncbi:YkyA family protein [Mesobacillus maritimus]|uniref:YkyA family protein n=1 Tax=Mesobacillus maritimus TaxID=1643336 RepID=A0ABS7K6R9_9BACI|nr:YkyA family protein [Mesobacillus maritimus]MBY0097968.1 YkyA family protein [Mesobacillus maritimus]